MLLLLRRLVVVVGGSSRRRAGVRKVIIGEFGAFVFRRRSIVDFDLN
jgi:hypothetical protein